MIGDAPQLVLAHAKVNLTLNVLARDDSGFHQLETLFCALELADEIQLAAASQGVHLTVAAPPEGDVPPPDLGPIERNLARRAAELFFRAADIEPAVRIRLTKRIPAGGGLGGGSSDAAAVLNALNRLYRQPIPRPRLLELAGQLGSDVPFFLAGSALAIAWGRGNRLLPLPPLPSAPVLLAVPPVRIDTGEAYAALAEARGHRFGPPAAIVHPGVRRWDDAASLASNDFEGIVFRRFPLLGDLRRAMSEQGAIMARMSGSGSTIFGVFDDAGAAESARASLAASFVETEFLLTRTLTYHEE
jgi:4-diphosphocytidyl-2-C-methyl-D-erythritol kinase